MEIDLHEVRLSSFQYVALDSTGFLVSCQGYFPLTRLRAAYLRSVVEGKTGRALDIEVSAIPKGVVGADDNLPRLISLPVSHIILDCWSPTGWLLPGSFTVTNCSSLYFSKAGVRLLTISGLVSSVSDLISVESASVLRIPM